MCGSAHAQAEGIAVSRLVRTQAAQRLQHEDPIVRGEAALVVAASADASLQAAIRALTTDDDESTRLRAILAMACLAAPASVVVLEHLLEDHQARVSHEGVVAAYALGMLPAELGGSATTRVLTSFTQTSWKRQREVAMALLLGLSVQDPSSQATVLRHLFDDESNRDPEVRSQLLLLLLSVDRTLDAKVLLRVLDRGSDDERKALLGWFAGNSSPFDGALAPRLETIAAKGPAAERATALAALTRMKLPSALVLAEKALHSSDPAESGQGLRSMLSLGGAGVLSVLERHLASETNHERQAALLAGYAAPLSCDLCDMCARLGADTLQPLSLRTAAATALARTAPQRSIPMLRDLFRTTPQRSALPAIASTLMRAELTPPPLARLLEEPVDLRHHPERWEALLQAGHPEATRAVLQCLTPPRDSSADVAMALAVWRRTMVLPPVRAVCAAAPAVLRKVLGG
ncbi:MAG TPA: HEAT repeat domain-containing protein [Planctomycetota bacterium]|nr:HEAT repeat domain-containing protein [Planctomycetota bacterium]